MKYSLLTSILVLCLALLGSSCKKDIQPVKDLSKIGQEHCRLKSRVIYGETYHYSYDQEGRVYKVIRQAGDQPPPSGWDNFNIEYDVNGHIVKVYGLNRGHQENTTFTYEGDRIVKTFNTYYDDFDRKISHERTYTYLGDKLHTVFFHTDSINTRTYIIQWEGDNISKIGIGTTGSTNYTYYYNHIHYDTKPNALKAEYYSLFVGRFNMDNVPCLSANNIICPTAHFEFQDPKFNCYYTYNEWGYLVNSRSRNGSFTHSRDYTWDCK
jgi:hypothetical protein